MHVVFCVPEAYYVDECTRTIKYESAWAFSFVLDWVDM